MVAIERLALSGRPAAWVAVDAGGTASADLDAAFAALSAALAESGLDLDDVVRNRLFAASREGRDAASGVRFERLSGPARCATSSYIDEAAFPGGEGARLETLAVAAAGVGKIVVDHDPRQPPCRFVATGDLVFLSGLTSTEPDLDRQLAHIRARVVDTLGLAETRLGRRVRPIAATAYVHRSVDLDRLPDLAERVGLAGLPLAIGRCDGFSRPGKLLELEIDAQAD